MISDPELVKQDTDTRQRSQAMSLDQRMAELVERFAPGRMAGWQIDEERGKTSEKIPLS